MVFQKFVCLLQLFLFRYEVGCHTAVFRFFHFRKNSGADPLFRRLAVQRIVDFLPCDGEVAVLPEMLVGKHLRTEVAELYVQADAAAESLGDGVEKQAENGFFVSSVFIFSLAVHAPVRIYKRWQPNPVICQVCQHVSDNAPVRGFGDAHERLLPWRIFKHPEESDAVKKVTTLHGWKVFRLVN